MAADRKLLWAANAVGLRLRGMRMQFPSYVGPTLYTLGRRRIRLGKRVRIWPGLRVEVYEGATLTIEDDVIIGANCHITVAADLTIGAGSNFTGANVITDITHALREMEKPSVERPWDVVPVRLGRRLFVGHGAKILPGAQLGDACTVGANAVVGAVDAPDGAVLVGVPATIRRVVA